jgi:hypothetical protein
VVAELAVVETQDPLLHAELEEKELRQEVQTPMPELPIEVEAAVVELEAQLQLWQLREVLGLLY